MSAYRFNTDRSYHVGAKFTEENLAKVQEIIKRYPEGKQKSAILPILHIAQTQFGWISVNVMDYIAELLNIQPIEVYEVATFYTMFHLEPVGKYVLEVCRTGPCMICGADEILEYLEQKLGIHVNETTPDKRFTLKTVECLAACGGAPCLQVKLKSMDGAYKYYENLTPAKIDELIATEWI
ncbi:MAG: NAD(P)H-dependent oxidoreductase subunit E [Bacteroidia bacterium]|nr:NAD(P)H-dependent oxidoreductase subunit E [Bacteroidia bacterium]MDW8300841.1 NAD(P)H-dependent oxidoreductase subunit E [Bacteroidia bacterium]